MTIAVPCLRSSPCDELPLSFESTVVLLVKRVWLDIRHDAGRWYASLRIKEPCAITHSKLTSPPPSNCTAPCGATSHEDRTDQH